MSLEDLVETIEHIWVAVGEIIEDEHFGTSVEEDLDDGMRADEAEASGDEQILNH